MVDIMSHHSHRSLRRGVDRPSMDISNHTKESEDDDSLLNHSTRQNVYSKSKVLPDFSKKRAEEKTLQGSDSQLFVLDKRSNSSRSLRQSSSFSARLGDGAVVADVVKAVQEQRDQQDPLEAAVSTLELLLSLPLEDEEEKNGPGTSKKTKRSSRKERIATGKTRQASLSPLVQKRGLGSKRGTLLSNSSPALMKLGSGPQCYQPSPYKVRDSCMLQKLKASSIVSLNRDDYDEEEDEERNHQSCSSRLRLSFSKLPKEEDLEASLSQLGQQQQQKAAKASTTTIPSSDENNDSTVISFSLRRCSSGAKLNPCKSMPDLSRSSVSASSSSHSSGPSGLKFERQPSRAVDRLRLSLMKSRVDHQTDGVSSDSAHDCAFIREEEEEVPPPPTLRIMRARSTGALPFGLHGHAARRMSQEHDQHHPRPAAPKIERRGTSPTPQKDMKKKPSRFYFLEDASNNNHHDAAAFAGDDEATAQTQLIKMQKMMRKANRRSTTRGMSIEDLKQQREEKQGLARRRNTSLADLSSLPSASGDHRHQRPSSSASSMDSSNNGMRRSRNSAPDLHMFSHTKKRRSLDRLIRDAQQNEAHSSSSTLSSSGPSAASSASRRHTHNNNDNLTAALANVKPTLPARRATSAGSCPSRNLARLTAPIADLMDASTNTLLCESMQTPSKSSKHPLQKQCNSRRSRTDVSAATYQVRRAQSTGSVAAALEDSTTETRQQQNHLWTASGTTPTRKTPARTDSSTNKLAMLAKLSRRVKSKESLAGNTNPNASSSPSSNKNKNAQWSSSSSPKLSNLMTSMDHDNAPKKRLPSTKLSSSLLSEKPTAQRRSMIPGAQQLLSSRTSGSNEAWASTTAVAPSRRSLTGAKNNMSNPFQAIVNAGVDVGFATEPRPLSPRPARLSMK